jgi:hypothetical protein
MEVQVKDLIQALEQAQEKVQELAAEQVRVLGLAAAQVRALAPGWVQPALFEVEGQE